jgi:hypothetical protein
MTPFGVVDPLFAAPLSTRQPFPLHVVELLERALGVVMGTTLFVKGTTLITKGTTQDVP